MEQKGYAMFNIDVYLNNSDWKVNENSNSGYSLQGMNNYIVNRVISDYWLNKYPGAISSAHISGDIHIHDLGSLSVYCCGWDLAQLLEFGFGGIDNKVESSPAKHFRTALGQIVNFIYTLQGEAAGAQALSNFDTLLAPFIRFDNLEYKDVLQAMQEFVFNMNVPTRVGFQSPFSNITMDLMVPNHFANLPVIIGGKFMKETYSEFQSEMDMLNKAFCEIMIHGDSKGRIFSFPIPTYSLTKDFNWDNPNLDSLWRMTARLGVPYFSNFINSDMNPEDARSLCCRLRIDNRELSKRSGGLFSSNPMTGSIGVVTINLPRIGYLASGNTELLFRLLESRLQLARESLIIKRNALEEYMNMGLYPYSKIYLSEIAKKNNGKYWHNHFNTIGIIGMNELCHNFFGSIANYSIGSKQGEELSLNIMDYILDRLSVFQNEDNQLYNLEATPGEGTSYRLANLDIHNISSDIITSGDGDDTDRYYTNSTNLPVSYTDSIFKALDHQDKFLSKYTGGSVFHCFLGESIDDFRNVRNLIKKIAQNYKLPYFSISPTFSICKIHGYIKGSEYICKKCDCITEVYSRVVGFYRPISQWNKGKLQEFHERKLYVS